MTRPSASWLRSYRLRNRMRGCAHVGTFASHRRSGEQAHMSLLESDMPNGVVVERRLILRRFVELAAACAVHRTAEATTASMPLRDAQWDDLFRRALPMARVLTRNPTSDEERYLQWLAQGLSRLRSRPAARFRHGIEVARDTYREEFPVMMLQYRFAPHARLPHHDHHDYNGALCVTSGEIRVRSFDLIEKSDRLDSQRVVHIRQSHETLLRTGGISTLSRLRDNIHELHAGAAGARLVDFFTMFSKDADSLYLNVEEKPVDSQRNIYRAHWLSG
jgi:hypothetical protein